MAETGYGILAGYDGSSCSEEALCWAVREARARQVRLTVCQAWPPAYPPPPGAAGVFDLARRSGEEILAQGMRKARALAGPSMDVRPLLADRPASAALCERSGSATMIVVGCRGRGGLAGMLLGSVSSQVAAHAVGRVVVVRGHWRPAAGYLPGPVVVGADGSAASQAAIAFAIEEAVLREAQVLAVCARADAPGALGGARRMQEEVEQAIAQGEKEHPEVTVRRQTALGAPRAALLAAASEVSAQMLVVGARGRGGIKGMTLGSVSQAALHHAPCPVGVVHPR